MYQRAICVGLIALSVASCQKKASGQTIAVVNNEEITASELNAQIASDPSLSGQNTEQARRSALQNLISRKLLVQQAKSNGIDKSPEFLTKLQRGTDDLLINMLLSRQMSTNSAPSAAEISQFEAAHPQMFANREIWTLSQIIYPLPKSPDVNSKISAADTLEQIAAILSSNGIQFTRAVHKVDTAAFSNEQMAQLTKVKPGSAFVIMGAGQAVASVITGREPAAPTPNQAPSLAISLIQKQQVNKILQDRVKSLRASAKIQYQPGYGPAAK